VKYLEALAFGTGLSVALVCTCILIEHFAGPVERYTLRQRLPGLLMQIAGTVLTIVLMWPVSWLWRQIGIAPTITVPLWSWLEAYGTAGYALQVLVLVGAADFLAYWRHRAEHRWFWGVHMVHHSPRELHAANDIAHPLQAFFSFVFITVPMSLIAVDGPTTPFTVAALVVLLSMYIHSPVEVHFGPVRRVVVDNRFHRIHHSLEPRHFDKNFSICFSVWDHMFGTAYDPGEEWPAVGLADVKPPRTLREFLNMPFQPGRNVAPDEAAGGGPGGLTHPTS
jgi:sterol desaturase/sphingolipid hydroxylase (fatty acid hydroxylase superfamily)